MRTVGVRELKAHLSRLLRDVQRGESVLVTDRGRVIAELRLPDPAGWGAGASSLARLASTGHVRVSEPSGNPYQRSPLKSPAGLSHDLLAAEREER